MKLRKTAFIFIIILVQSALAVTAGFAAISIAAGDTLPPQVFVGELDIGSMDKADAAKKIEEYFKAVFLKKDMIITAEGKDYTIPYADVDFSVDGAATADSLNVSKAAGFLPGMVRTYFGNEKLYIHPVVKFNEGKLRQKLIELSGRINKAPVNASLSIKDGQLVRKAETPGYTLNVSNAVEVIRKQLSGNPGTSVLLGAKNNYEIQIVNADVRLKDFEGIEQIISEYSTDIIDTELFSSVELAAGAINGSILEGAGAPASQGDVFSFVESLKKADEGFENDNEGYDQVASTLYAALLIAGIDKDAITRLPHKLATDYIEPGLDAWISGSGGDLKFRNTLAHKIALFAEVNENRLTVRLAGSLLDKSRDNNLKIETVQRFKPPVVNIENTELKPGEKIMLNPGREGIMVEVRRDNELISTDTYEAEKAIVQVGPGTDWEGDTEK